MTCRRRERVLALGRLWLSEAARARAQLAGISRADLDASTEKLVATHWRGTFDDATHQLAALRALPAIRRPVLDAVRDHGPLSTEALAALDVRFAGRALTADEISFVIADAVDAGLLVPAGDAPGPASWRVAPARGRGRRRRAHPRTEGARNAHGHTTTTPPGR